MEKQTYPAKLSLMDDIQLWKTANSMMDKTRQMMLSKAEAPRLLAQRGHRVFEPADR